ncbi:MAG: hypothetical protein P8Y02_11850 [Deinococcales bacterium]
MRHRFAYPVFLVLALLAACTGEPKVLTIVPDTYGAYGGESHDFAAWLSDQPTALVTWEATCGTLSGGGETITFTAPKQDAECTLAATSTEDPSLSATSVITVYRGTNNPPDVTEFAASPTSVALGTATTFTWAFHDPDGDTIRCALDVDNDGVADYTFSDCEAVTEQAYTYASEGAYVPTLAYNDDHGASGKLIGSASVTSATTPPPSVTAPDILLFTASSSHITEGESTDLRWTVAGTDPQLTIEPDVGDVTGSSSVTVTPTTTTTYTLTATNSAGTVLRSQVITVDPPPTPPEISYFTATPDHITAGDSTTLAWEMTGTSPLTVRLTPGSEQILPAGQYSFSRSPVDTTTYSLTVTNTLGSASASVTVTVSPPPVPPTITSFTATPQTIVRGESTTLTWSGTGTEPLTYQLDQGIGNVTGLPSTTVSPTADMSYLLSADNAAGNDTAALTVWVTPDPQSGPLLAGIDQFGTNGDDFASAVSLGGAGDIYVAGGTDGRLDPPTHGGYDAFVARSNSAGAPIWTRQLGTAADDYAYAVAASVGGSVYVAGATAGDLVGSNAGGDDAFVAKLDASGKVAWMRQLGTAADEQVWAVAAAPDDGVYLTGSTLGSLGGTSAGFWDAFVVRYDADGNQLWLRQLGSASSDTAYDIALSNAGNPVIAGETNGALAGPATITGDVFIAAFDANGALLWVRQLGSSGIDTEPWVAADAAGDYYLTGTTTGDLDSNHPNGSFDTFLAKYDNAGSLLWLRQFGSAGTDGARGLAVTPKGDVLVAGKREDATIYSLGTNALFLASFDPAGVWTGLRYVPIDPDDQVAWLATGADGASAVVGSTAGSLGAANLGQRDVYVARFLP